MIVPEIGPVLSYKEAVAEAASMDLFLLPYEDSESLSGAGGMELTRSLIGGLEPGKKCAVLIGPEGGFSDLKDRDGGAFCAFSRWASFGGLIF